MTDPIEGTSTRINPILLQAANEAAAVKSEFRAFIAGNDLNVLAREDMARGGFWPKDMRLPIGVPDLLLRSALGLSPQAVVLALSEHGIDKLDGQRVEVSHDPIAKKNFVRVYTPNAFGTLDNNGNPASNVEIPGKWLEITPKTPAPKPAVDTNAPHRPIAERVAETAAKLSSDPRSAQLKQIFGNALALRAANGEPTDPDDLWKQVQAAAVPGPNNTPSKLEIMSTQLSAAFLGDADMKNGQINWEKPGVKEKVMGRAKVIQMGLLGNAARVLAKNADGTPKYKNLDRIAAEVTKDVEASDRATPGQHTALSNPKLKSELESLVGGKLVGTEAPVVIGHGRNDDALKARLDTINNAKSDINYAMWKFYPDSVGTQTADALAAAAKRGVKVNVLVDGNVSSRDAKEKALLEKMRAAGVNVVESKNSQIEDAMNGMHAKMILADCSAEALAKGLTPTRLATDRNDGEQYLTGVAGKDDTGHGWSGSDMVFKGAGAAQGMKAFTDLFNHWAPEGQKLAASSIPSDADLKKLNVGKNLEGEVMSIIDVPGSNNQQKISKAIEKLLNSMRAGQTVKIDQAYFMGLPGIEKALTAAMERGVNLDVIYNSAESCDVPGISIGTNAILERLNNASKSMRTHDGKAGKLTMNEYVGKQTLHDKMMVFGDQCVIRMSWNQHGRSQELESEDADIIFGTKVAEAASANFAKVKENTRSVTAPTLSAEERMYAQLFKPLAMDLM